MTKYIAIVGSGPSGCFTAQALRKLSPEVGIDLIDSLPVPYGLVRYGVAPDHQGTKAVSRQFERLFERQNIGFLGNLTLGRDITLDQLRAQYDAVVLAAGLTRDRRLGLEGEDLTGVIGAGALTRTLYDHPDAGPLPPLGRDVVIIGNGNVAIDLLRLLAKTPDELDGTDLGPEASDWLAKGGVETLTILGRSPAAVAKFDPVMIKELQKLTSATITVEDLEDDDDANKTIAALRDIHGHATGDRRITFRFGAGPVEIEEQGGKVVAVAFRSAGGDFTLPCDLLVTAIGFEDDESLQRVTLMRDAVDPDIGVIEPGLYTAGWFRHGPRGTIPDNRADARVLAERVIADVAAMPGGKPGRAGLPADLHLVDFHGWKRIDTAETVNCPPGRCRIKLTTRAAMLAVAGGRNG